METRKIVGLIGSGVLILGVFLPLVSMPMVGTINYYNNGKGDGVGIVIFALISIVLIFLNKLRGLAITGILSLSLTLYTFTEIQSQIAGLKTELLEAPNGFAQAIGQLAYNSFQIEWGFAVLLLGTLALLRSASYRYPFQDELAKIRS
jgi:hypothetical protein